MVFIAYISYFIYIIFFPPTYNDEIIVEPITGLTYTISEEYRQNEDFTLIVTPINENELPEYTESDIQINENGIKYFFIRDTVCYKDHVSSLDPDANRGKEEISCVDRLGSRQESYYIFFEDTIYLFTTQYPTRIVFFDPGWGYKPARISEYDFKKLIESLQE